MKNNTENAKKNSTRLISLIILLIVATVAILAGNTVAKYLFGQNYDSVFEAKDFYFESDLLTADGNETYVLPEGYATVSFNLFNYADSLRVSEVAIKYTVDVYKVEGGTETKVDSACKPVATLELPTEPEKKNTASISINELTTSGTYKVVVNSTAPYTKMLSANFVITAAQTPSEAVSFTVNDQENSPVLYLNISVGNYSGALNLTLPAGIYPDPTDDKYEELKTNTITVEKYSSYRFVYFKDDISVKHDASAFEVEPVEP